MSATFFSAIVLSCDMLDMDVLVSSTAGVAVVAVVTAENN